MDREIGGLIQEIVWGMGFDPPREP